MLFNSLQFVVFFPAVVALFFACPPRFRWALLLAASYVFYMCWEPVYVLLIIGSTLVDYCAALLMARCAARRHRRKYLALSIAANLGLLFSFKYFNFFNASLQALFAHWGLGYYIPTLHVLLPVGISFYTFQTLSYTIDVYRGERQPERHLGVFALYVAFFPQLVAGPIERSTRLLPQFFERQRWDGRRVREGLALMLWGYFQKIVIADRLALFVNTVYNNPDEYHGFPVLLATYFFAFQIYCDFSGYSCIAIGAARVMGFDLMENFRRPYFARSVGEFWKRWHISLSSWFRDYLYIPLGGNRVPMPRWLLNVMVVFLLSGLWHGANWTFVVWGALHGGYLVAGRATEKLRGQVAAACGLGKVPWLRRVLSTLTTFHLVLFGWVWFRANSLGDAVLLLKNMAVPERAVRVFDTSELGVALFFIAALEVVHLAQRGRPFLEFVSAQRPFMRWSLYYFLALSLLLFGVFTAQEFYYFQF